MNYPLCPGLSCPKKMTCNRYSEVIHEDDMAFTHAPWDDRRKRCEFYSGPEENSLREYIKDLLNGHDNKKE